MSFKIRRYKTFFFFFLFLHAASFLCGQEAVSGRVKRIAAAAFGRNSKEEIVPFMENEIAFFPLRKGRGAENSGRLRGAFGAFCSGGRALSSSS